MNFSMFDNMGFDNRYHRCPDDDRNVSLKDTNDLNRFPDNSPIAMAYVPVQQWDSVYDEAKALSAGTIFPELDLPFDPEGGCYGQR